MAGILLDQRRDVFGDVLPDRFGARQHQFRLIQHLVSRIPDEEGVGEVRDQESARSEDYEQDEVELREKSHGTPP